MNLKHTLAKLISILLIASGIFNIIYSTYLLLVIYPKLKISYDSAGLILQEGMVEKAFTHYISLIINGFYGIGLLFKPKEKIGYIQIIGGVVVFLLTTFFVVKTPITGDPLLETVTKFIFPQR